AAKFFRGDFHWPRRWRGSGSRLRKGGRHRGVESDVAFDLLQDLMNVTVQYGYRGEALQESKRAFAVARSPAPLRIDGPERDVSENDDRRFGAKSFHIRFEPIELFIAELAQTAGLELENVDQSNEMDAVLVEAVPAGAFGVDAL